VKSGPKFDTEKNRVFDPSLRQQKLCWQSPGGDTDSEYAKCNQDIETISSVLVFI